VTSGKKENTDVQGVFVIRNRKAEFHEVVTGLTGTTEIQVKSGLQPGDEIITGSYKVLKTLRNGAGVKVDNSLANKGES
jgi:HlyD family secretion protein